MNEDNLKIKVEGFSRMPEGDKKNQVVEQINYLCQELGGENNVCVNVNLMLKPNAKLNELARYRFI
jgi:hypothetical protein